jgi:hypothetical protein
VPSCAPFGAPVAAKRDYGRLVAGAIVCAYFAALFAVGGRSEWQVFWVPDLLPPFVDMASLTSAWECTRDGVEVLPSNPCDPFGRPANYPKLWLLPAPLGLGQESTVALGITTGVLFFGSFLLLIGGATIGEGIVYGIALISPAVMLGVERGNADFIVFAILVAVVLLFRARAAWVRVAAHAVLLLAAMLKLFPAFAFGLLGRQPRRWRLIAGGSVLTTFALYVLVTLSDIRTINRVLPQSNYFSYGADVGLDAARGWLASRVARSLVGSPTTATVTTTTLVVLALATSAALAWRRTGRAGVDSPVKEDARALDAFVVGAGIYVGSFAVTHNFDYRLAFLLLTLPQLLVWASTSNTPLPAPRLTLAAVIATLWLGEVLTIEIPDAPWEEVLNWLIFISFTTALFGLVAKPVRGVLRGMAR